MEITNYPLNFDEILQKKRSILRSLREGQGLIPKKIAVLSGSTIGDTLPCLEIFLLNAGIRPEFYTGEYGRFYEDIVFDEGSLKDFAPDIIYFHTTSKNISSFPALFVDEKTAAALAVAEFSRFSTALDIACGYGSIVIQNNFEMPLLRCGGNAEGYFSGGNVRFTARLNELLAEYALSHKDVFINDINYLSASCGLNLWYDETSWFAYKYAFSPKFIPAVCQSISAIIKATMGKSKKALVLDLDNTLWGGIIGDDGKDGIEIGNESPLGMAHLSLCEYVKRLKDQGIMLSVCSKNEEDVAKSGFLRNEMPLNVDDFLCFTANWNPKSDNLRDIIKTLNILDDAVVFADDNPAERQIIKQELPCVAVPELLYVDNFAKTIDNHYFFEVSTLTDDDIKRTEFLKGNILRGVAQQNFTDYGAYLDSLGMTCVVVAVNTENISRVTQLINKTNQFNLTTRRYSENEVSEIMQNKEYITLCANLTDKFGDNGLVCVLFARCTAVCCSIELFILSCRVFRRELEFAVLDTLVSDLKKRGSEKLVGTYIQTAKNKPCSDFYSMAGFKKTEEWQDCLKFECYVKDYTAISTHITVERKK